MRRALMLLALVLPLAAACIPASAPPTSRVTSISLDPAHYSGLYLTTEPPEPGDVPVQLLELEAWQGAEVDTASGRVSAIGVVVVEEELARLAASARDAGADAIVRLTIEPLDSGHVRGLRLTGMAVRRRAGRPSLPSDEPKLQIP